MIFTASDHDAEVLIVGMGPTGAALAGLLGQRGIRTVVIDRLPALHPLPRAVGMDHEVMRIAQELQIAPRLEGYVVPYRPSEYHGVDGDVIKRLDSPPPPYRLGWEPMFAFDQPAFETVLRERVGELNSVSVSLEAEVLAFGQDETGAWVDVATPGSHGPRRVRGAYLVACDGGTSQVRNHLGIEMTDLGFHENWLVVDVLIEDDATLARLPQTQVQYCEPDRPATFVNLIGRHRRWEISLKPGELAVGAVDNDAVWPWLERWIKPGEARIWRAAAYMFHGLVAEEWRRDRILLAGDAAHMTPPFMAQGMAQGMRDVQNLAWKLDAVLSGWTDRLLDTYESERRTHVLTTTRHTIELGRVISERDEQLARARDAEALAPYGGQVPVTFRSNFLPALADGLLAAETLGAGEIVPQPFVYSRGERVRLDDEVGTGFRVIAASTVSDSELDRLRQLAKALGARVVRVRYEDDPAGPGGVDDRSSGDVVECDGVMNGWLTSLGAVVAIARPDQYIYATARAVPEAELLIARLADECGVALASA